MNPFTGGDFSYLGDQGSGAYYPATGTFAVIRALRLLRIFRVLKLSRFLVEGNLLWQSLLRSSRKIGVFLFGFYLILRLFQFLINLVI